MFTSTKISTPTTTATTTAASAYTIDIIINIIVCLAYVDVATGNLVPHPSTFSGQSQTFSFWLKTKFCGQGI